MSQDLPNIQPFIRLLQANMLLMTPGYLSGLSGGSGPLNPMTMSGLLLQEWIKNYAEFWTEMQHGAASLFATGRAGLVTLASEV